MNCENCPVKINSGLYCHIIEDIMDPRLVDLEDCPHMDDFLCLIGLACCRGCQHLIYRNFGWLECDNNSCAINDKFYQIMDKTEPDEKCSHENHHTEKVNGRTYWICTDCFHNNLMKLK